MVKKDRFIKLIDYDNDSIFYIDPEEIIEIANVPKTDKHEARTRIMTSSKSLYLVKESAEMVHIKIISTK